MYFRISLLSALCLLALLSLFKKADAQATQPPFVPQVIPPSPNAASLGLYGEFQVGYYTGTVNPSIPLYTIKTNQNELDIKLSYLSTGLKVSEDASWVGLNWSLQAGGVITKSTRGKADLYGNTANTYLTHFPTSSNGGYCCGINGSQQANNDWPYLKGVYEGSTDGEPDIYYYNFGSYSGKFNFNILPDGDKAYECNKTNLKIQVAKNINGNPYGWIITDPLGYVYYFSTAEFSTNYSISIPNPGNQAQIENGEKTGVSNLSASFPNNTNAWYLDSIASPRGEKIRFQYATATNPSLSLTSKSYKRFEANGTIVPNGTPCTTAPYPQSSVVFYSASRQAVSDVYLSKITFNSGYVTFHTSDRSDIEGLNGGHPQKVDGMSIFDLNNNLVKKYQFYQTYFNPLSPVYYNKRLKLDSVAVFGSTSRLSSYKFTYADQNNLPGKYSKAQDSWGYYNGADSLQSLLPPTTINVAGTPTYFPGGNRNPSSSIDTVQKGILTSITYPTGGKSVFDYELNECSNGPQQYQSMGVAAQSNPYSGVNTPASFSLTTQTNVSFTLSVSGPTNTSTIYGTLTQNGQLIKSFYTNDNTYANMVLPAGTYNLQVISTSYIVMISAGWNVPSTQNPIAGGVRIKRITDYDPLKQVSVKKYIYTNYDNATSSGLIIAKPVYEYPIAVTQTITCPDGGATFEGTTQYTARESSSVIPLGFMSQSNAVAYSRVVELQGENGENGKTEFSFNNRVDYPGAGTIPTVPGTSWSDNGQLTRKRVFDKSGSLLLSSTINYTRLASDTVKGIKIVVAPFSRNVFYYPDNNSSPGAAMQWGSVIRFYNNLSEWWVQSSIIDTTYRNGQPVTTTKNMYYDNPAHLQLTRTSTINSDGKVLTSFTTYADDYAAGTTFINDMKTSHLTGLPVEQVSYQTVSGNTTILSGKVTQYKTGGMGLVDNVSVAESVVALPLSGFKFSNTITGQLPAQGQGGAFATDSRYKPRLYCTYNTTGDLITVNLANGPNIAYQWGYNRQYPIAECKNAASTEFYYEGYEGTGTANGGRTGGKYSTNPAVSWTKPNTRTYVISYWYLNGSVWKYSGVLPYTGPTYTMQTAIGYDDVRIFPLDAQMTTYTYDPLTGMTSITDEKGLTAYYEYDGFQRLLNVKDQDGNILKSYDYHYISQ